MTDVTAKDLVELSLTERPLDFEAAMFEIMRQKANYAIELKKAEFAKSLFGDPKVEEPVEEVEIEEHEEDQDNEEEESDGEDSK